MKLFLRQAPENGWLGGPKEKQFTLSYKSIDYEITVEQCAERQITILSPEISTSENLLAVFHSLDMLLMLFDGQFYSVNGVFENNIEVTHSFQKRLLPSCKSADFMIGVDNILIDYENALSAVFLRRWIALRDELDLIHKMMLYSVSSVQMPVDMKCAFMTESFLGLSELVNEKKKDFILPSIQKGNSKLKKYLTVIIEYYGQDIFHKECEKSKEQFAKILVDSRNRIAHIKSKQERRYLNGKESVLYLGKLSLLYRVVLFDLLEIPEEFYNSKLQRRTDTLNQYHGIVNGFLEKLNDENP
ncbi:MAG: hypothetical protein CVV02_14705 [Firmicutes bacterium HGW-Firmicutes-7]|nr:MAG: hypothetical protein CVV02_14705 [Firmicutes bacterium HGW-Firmicutes-7]